MKSQLKNLMEDPKNNALASKQNLNNQCIEKAVSPTMVNETRQNWSGRDVFWITAGIALTFLTVTIGYRLYKRMVLPLVIQPPVPSIWISLGLGFLEGVILVGSVYYLGLRRRGFPWANAGIRPAKSEWLLIGVCLGIFAIPLSGLIALSIQLIFNLPVSNPQLPFLAPDGFSWLGAIGMLLMGGIVAPFAEELYFRGVLYTWLRQRWGVHIATLASSMIFGIVHGNVALAGAAFVLGIMLAWVFERSNSLWPAVLIHIINNSVKIILLYILLAYNLMPVAL